MRAMVLMHTGQPLMLQEIPIPEPGANDLLLQVKACGICRTDLHVIDGELSHPQLPLVLGHQIIGVVQALGSKVNEFTLGQRVGVPWLGGSCGHCFYCQNEQENLCDQAVYTGYQLNGGLAEYCVANSQFCFAVPEDYPDLQAAPLFCAGLIGYRALNKTQNAQRLGFYGFGASAHILTQFANYQGKSVYAFVKPDDLKSQAFAKQLGVKWAGSTTQQPPELLDAAIIFAPSGELVPLALKNVRKGGIVVCAGIHMSDIPSFPYHILWGERVLCSVANLTRQDGTAFLKIVPKIPIQTHVTVYPLEQANQALTDLRTGKLQGAAVIKI